MASGGTRTHMQFRTIVDPKPAKLLIGARGHWPSMDILYAVLLNLLQKYSFRSKNTIFVQCKVIADYHPSQTFRLNTDYHVLKKLVNF